ncbi:MAG: PLDc N-terminal domain-containing protein [Porticoccaceae bacterium]
MGIEVGGLFGLLILIADVWAIVKTVGGSASTKTKVVWVVLILVLPVLGLILWLLMGPKAP